MAHKDNVRKFLDVSTANLTEDEAALVGDTENIIYSVHSHGMWVWVAPDDVHDKGIAERGYPNLVAVMKVARELDCPWINFDADAETLDGLPTFDW